MSWLHNHGRSRHKADDQVVHLPAVTETWPSDGGRPPWMVDGLAAHVVAGNDTLEVIVDSDDQDILWAVAGLRLEAFSTPVTTLLVAEDGHVGGPEAVSVWISGYRVGYLPSEDAALLREGIIDIVRTTGRAVAVSGIVASAGADADGQHGQMGLWLQHDPTYLDSLAGRVRELPKSSELLGA